jgi:hypothetical protein
MDDRMRTIYGLLAIGLLTFVAGLAFFVLGARNAWQPAADAPVASVTQIMRGMVVPAANGVYNAVATTVTAQGTQEVFPRNDREWQGVGASAVTLVEAANLLKLDGRARDRGDWMRMSDAMSKAAMLAYRATERKDVEALLAAGEVLNNSCDSCLRTDDVPVE